MPLQLIKDNKPTMKEREQYINSHIQVLNKNLCIEINDCYPTEFLLHLDLYEYKCKNASYDFISFNMREVINKYTFDTLCKADTIGGCDQPYITFIVKLNALDNDIILDALEVQHLILTKLFN